MTQYLRSSTPGKTWSFYAYKPQGRPAYVAATEGVLSDEHGFTSFQTILFQDRTIRQEIPTRMTDKAKNLAAYKLYQLMRAEGLLADDARLSTDAW